MESSIETISVIFKYFRHLEKLILGQVMKIVTFVSSKQIYF